MGTYVAKPDSIEHKWWVVDANGKTLGRLSTQIAAYLRGKHKPTFTPHADTGDFIVVINAEQVRVTANKALDKKYYRHSGYPGGLKDQSFNELSERKPERIIELAVKGMLPRGPLGRQMFRKLKVYAGGEHPHAAQQPQQLEIEE